MTKKSILKEALHKAMSYSEYRQKIDELRAAGEATGGHTSEAMLDYTDLNLKRMDKWDKIIKVNEALRHTVQQLAEPEIWLVLTEGWCGDAAHIVPVLNHLASQSDKIELKLILRDENLPLMDLYLTDGGRSIPKLVRLSANDHREIGVWGPRPAPAQELFLQGKRGERNKEDISKELQLFYGRDRGQTILRELHQMLQST